MGAWDNAPLLRKTANMLIGFSVLTALGGMIYYIVKLPTLFPIRSVYLSTAPQRIIPLDVLRVVHSKVNGNFFTVDIERFRQSLEQLPWVRNVNVRREFPDRLVVHFEEHQALARWNNSALVNMQGEVFNSGRNMMTKPDTGANMQILPDFIGQASDSREIAQRYAQFNHQLAALNLQVRQLALSQRHAWQLRLSNGMVVELGREEMQQRLARFIAAYPYSLAMQKTEDSKQRAENAEVYVDMRYRNGFAVRQNGNDKG